MENKDKCLFDTMMNELKKIPYQGNSGIKHSLVVKEDGVYDEYSVDNHVFTSEMVISKETFIQAYKMYIENKEEK